MDNLKLMVDMVLWRLHLVRRSHYNEIAEELREIKRVYYTQRLGQNSSVQDLRRMGGV